MFVQDYWIVCEETDISGLLGAAHLALYKLSSTVAR